MIISNLNRLRYGMNNKSEKFVMLSANFIFLLVVLTIAVIYSVTDLFLFKTIASILFFLIAIINFIKAKKNNFEFAVFMLIALGISMIADIVINDRFILGALTFALAHIFYFFSLNSLEKFRFRNLLYAVPFFIICVLLIFFLPNLNTISLNSVAVIYSVIISVMVGKALANLLKSRKKLYILIFTAYFLFFFSDVMLVIGYFAHIEFPQDLCRLTYYPAQCFMAYSIYMAGLTD